VALRLGNRVHKPEYKPAYFNLKQGTPGDVEGGRETRTVLLPGGGKNYKNFLAAMKVDKGNGYTSAQNARKGSYVTTS